VLPKHVWSVKKGVFGVSWAPDTSLDIIAISNAFWITFFFVFRKMSASESRSNPALKQAAGAGYGCGTEGSQIWGDLQRRPGVSHIDPLSEEVLVWHPAQGCEIIQALSSLQPVAEEAQVPPQSCGLLPTGTPGRQERCGGLWHCCRGNWGELGKVQTCDTRCSCAYREEGSALVLLQPALCLKITGSENALLLYQSCSSELNLPSASEIKRGDTEYFLKLFYSWKNLCDCLWAGSGEREVGKNSY